MPLEGHYERQTTPMYKLSQRERRAACGALAVTIVAMLAVVLFTVGDSNPPTPRGCIKASVAGIVGVRNDQRLRQGSGSEMRPRRTIRRRAFGNRRRRVRGAGSAAHRRRERPVPDPAKGLAQRSDEGRDERAELLVDLALELQLGGVVVGRRALGDDRQAAAAFEGQARAAPRPGGRPARSRRRASGRRARPDAGPSPSRSAAAARRRGRRPV